MNAESNLTHLVIADLSPVEEMITCGVYIYIYIFFCEEPCNIYIYIYIFHGSSEIALKIATRSNSV